MADPATEQIRREAKALEQIAVVCTDNMDQSCNHRMALDFVRQVANAALAATEQPLALLQTESKA